MNDKELIEYWKERFQQEKKQKFDLLEEVENIKSDLSEINNWNEFKEYVTILNNEI